VAQVAQDCAWSYKPDLHPLKAAGAAIVKPPQDTFWGGFSVYFDDLDGYYWEAVWGPMFDHPPEGSLRFKG
jgi:uncharacterized protein